MIATPTIQTPVLIYDAAGDFLSRSNLEEAFPEEGDRAAALADLQASGMHIVGGGASPLVTVTLDMWSAFPVEERH